MSDKIYFCTRCYAHFMTLTLMEFSFHPGKQQLYAMHFKVQYTNSAKLVQQFSTKQFHSILRHVNTGKRIVKDSRQNNTTLQSTSILFSYRIRACVCVCSLEIISFLLFRASIFLRVLPTFIVCLYLLHKI